ncbi:MAG TPA: helix-turn-helix domain-containing protein [Pyrinomonadaceae bacterium]|nr:helix-turn-helix domain-containing protein [Pyrinomonadaceae bacterium]
MNSTRKNIQLLQLAVIRRNITVMTQQSSRVMPSTKPRRRDLPENRRICILNAARCVFARQGYAETVVDDIAGQAGIAKGTLYLYFKSKEDIYLAALIEDARRLEALTRERIEAAPTWHEKVKAYVCLRLDYLETNEDFLRIYLAEVRSMMVRNARMQCELYHVIRESENHLARVFAAAKARNEIRPVDPELAASTVCDLTRGLMERRVLGWSRANSRDDAHFALDLLCRALELNKESSPPDSAKRRKGASPHRPKPAP